MTAIIAILNKSAVALSADSAVTIGTGNSKKVYNYANKVFNLSTGNPIGVMVFNNAEFCGIPWETIIKMYRGHSNNKPLPTVKDYRDDFINFLKQFITQYFEGGEDDTAVKNITRSVVTSLNNEFMNVVKRMYSTDDIDKLLSLIQKLSQQEQKDLYLGVASNVINSTLKQLENLGYHPDFSEGDIKDVTDKYGRIIKNGVGELLNRYALQDNEALLEQLITIALLATVKTHFFETATGIVFTGFGESQVFPSLHSINVGCVVNGKIRYSFSGDHAITQKKPATLIPFAQTDIMQTFVEGIDPQLKVGLPEFVKIALNEIKDYVTMSIDGSTDAEKALISTLDDKINLVLLSVISKLETARRRLHIAPMMTAISTLSKEDLTAMAESLINATFLHRRASFAEESVGGPVDVAVITKGDGFIWIKRKHYFEPALNLNYTSRVLNSKPNVV